MVNLNITEAVNRLLEDCSDLKVRDEYWITPEGTLHANGDNSDYNHEGHVIEHVINLISDHFGLEWDGGPDGVAFRTMLNDEVFPERYGDDEEDPYQRMRDELVAGGVFRSQQEAEAATSTFGGNDDDARAFAINYWGWIRVAGPNIEVPDMSERTLKAAGEALADIVFEESDCDDMEAINAIPIRVSTYSGRRALGSGRREATIGELIAGESGAGNTELADIAKSGGDAVRKMDTALQNPYYKGRLGDSTSVRDAAGRLTEGTNSSVADRSKRLLGLPVSENVAKLLVGVTARSLVEKFDVYEWHDRVDRVKFKMLDQFLANPDGRWVLKRVPAALAKRIWLEYGKRNTISDANGLDKIAEIMLDGIAALRVATQLQGHSDDGMGYHEMFDEVYDWDDGETDQKVDPEKLYQFLTVQLDGEHKMEFLSDYGLKPLERLVPQIADEEDPVKRLHALDRAFNICHQRSDLSAFFIEGGQSTLQAIADQGGYVEPEETKPAYPGWR